MIQRNDRHQTKSIACHTGKDKTPSELTHLYPISFSTVKYHETKSFPLPANGSLQWGNVEQFLHWNWIKELTVDRFMLKNITHSLKRLINPLCPEYETVGIKGLNKKVAFCHCERKVPGQCTVQPRCIKSRNF